MKKVTLTLAEVQKLHDVLARHQFEDKDTLDKIAPPAEIEIELSDEEHAAIVAALPGYEYELKVRIEEAENVAEASTEAPVSDNKDDNTETPAA